MGYISSGSPDFTVNIAFPLNVTNTTE